MLSSSPEGGTMVLSAKKQEHIPQSHCCFSHLKTVRTLKMSAIATDTGCSGISVRPMHVLCCSKCRQVFAYAE
jgi:ribosomal protein L34E